jgi:hypothetical protein
MLYVGEKKPFFEVALQQALVQLVFKGICENDLFIIKFFVVDV